MQNLHRLLMHHLLWLLLNHLVSVWVDLLLHDLLLLWHRLLLMDDLIWLLLVNRLLLLLVRHHLVPPWLLHHVDVGVVKENLLWLLLRLVEVDGWLSDGLVAVGGKVW
jgi:hypothetical protein